MTMDRAVLLVVTATLLAYAAFNELRWRQRLMPSTDIVGMASVIDGDTIEIHGTHIRLMGIDAPESGQSCEANDVKYRCGQKASFVLADMLKDKTVTCHDSGERSYKRVLAHCFVGGIDVQREMVRQGWAIAYRRYSQDYVKDEDEANAAQRGIWAGPFVEPEVWRHSKSAENER